MKHLSAADQRRALVAAFTEAVIQIVDRAVLSQVQSVVGDALAPDRVRTSAAPAAPAAARRKQLARARRPLSARAPRPTPAETAPPVARTPRPTPPKKAAAPARDADVVASQILELVQRRPGLGAEDARTDLGIDRGAWSSAIAGLILEGKVRREGDRRSASYYPAAAPTPFVPVPPIRRKARTAA